MVDWFDCYIWDGDVGWFMRLYLTVFPDDMRKGNAKWRSYEKQVDWPCVPAKDETIFVGSDEDGKDSSLNARVTGVYFHSSGRITVEAEIHQCREEFEDVCETVVRGGFVLDFTNIS